MFILTARAVRFAECDLPGNIADLPRLELANPGGRLVPGMSVQMQFTDARAEKVLLIPTEAVIQTGKRTVVMLAEENGGFRPVDVEAGIESAGQTEIKRGLEAGQKAAYARGPVTTKTGKSRAQPPVAGDHWVVSAAALRW